MARRTSRRIVLALVAAFATLVSLSVEAAAAISVSDTVPEKVDTAYERLAVAASAVVGVKVKALPNARSNESLGQERTGSGVVIGKDGLVLTISYLVLEADQVQVVDVEGNEHSAMVVAYDHATGFGLVKTLAPLPVLPIRFGTAKPVGQLDRLMVVTGGEEQAISIATVVSKRKFAGYWEYLIDDAIFTTPPRLDHSGAALINKDGELVGIGSLFVLDALTPGERLPGNMFVPIDLLKPVLEEMVKTGEQQASRRPWIGVNSLEEDGRVKVMQVNEESPADRAGIKAGDIILSVNGESIDSLEQFYNTLWTRGPAGVDVTLTVVQGPVVREVTVRSITRHDFIRRKPTV